MSDNRNYENLNTEQENKSQDYDYGEPVQYGSQNQTTQNYQDPYQNTPPEEPAGMAIASLVLGIVSIVLSCTYINIVTGIIAIVLGAIHLAKHRSRRGMAIAGIVLSIISIVVLIIIVAIGLAVLGSNPGLYNEILNEL